MRVASVPKLRIARPRQTPARLAVARILADANRVWACSHDSALNEARKIVATTLARTVAEVVDCSRGCIADLPVIRAIRVATVAVNAAAATAMRIAAPRVDCSPTGIIRNVAPIRATRAATPVVNAAVPTMLAAPAACWRASKLADADATLAPLAVARANNAAAKIATPLAAPKAACWGIGEPDDRATPVATPAANVAAHRVRPMARRDCSPAWDRGAVTAWAVVAKIKLKPAAVTKVVSAVAADKDS